MKKINFIFVFLSVFILTESCGNKTQTDAKPSDDVPYVSTYDEMLKDSFDIILNEIADNPVSPSREDSLYAKLCVSVKTMASSNENFDKNACLRTMKLADELVRISNNNEYKIKYLEAKLIALGFLKDKKEMFNTQKLYIKLYPEDKPGRFLSLGMLYQAVNKTDSAQSYYNKEIVLCENAINESDNEEMKDEAIACKFAALMLQNRDTEARSFLNSQEGSSNIEQMKNDVRTDELYQQLKDYFLSQIEQPYKNSFLHK